MAKFFAPQGVSQIDVTGARTGVERTIKRDSQGFFIAETAQDIKTLQQAGLGEASAMGVVSGGDSYVCSGCGFNGFFAVCGKCGTNNKVVAVDVTKVVADSCDTDNCDCEKSE